jgi:hypothetical protein
MAAGNCRNAAARACSTSDVSEGERKKEEQGLVAAVVCCSLASRGTFYRVERGRELGFPNLGLGGKNPGRGGSVDDARSRGRVGGVVAPLLVGWHRVLTSARSPRVLSGLVTGRQRRRLFHRPWPGSGLAPVKDRQRGELGGHRVHLRVLGRTAAASSTVGFTFLKTAH